MHVNNAIRDWYNGAQDYWQGITLFAMSGADPALLALMRQGPTPFTTQRLKDELLRIFNTGQPADEKQTATAPETPPGLKDPVLQELYDQKVALHKEKDMLRAQLKFFPTDEERGVAAHRILTLRDAITAVWATEDYYKLHGRLPEADPGVTDPAMLKLRRERANSYVRRYRNLVKKFPGNEKFLAKLQHWEQQYEQLKEKVNKYKALVDGKPVQ